MKVKLYHKFVEAARKHALKRKIARRWMFKPKTDDNLFVCRPAKCFNEEGKLVMDDSKLVKDWNLQMKDMTYVYSI